MKNNINSFIQNIRSIINMSRNTIGGSLFVAIATVTINYYLFEKGRFDKLEEKINELLMQSVKAKINLLEHN